MTDVLGLTEYNEAEMDKQMEYATILGNTVTFHFRDGHEAFRDFHDKRHGTKWTEERRVKQSQAIRDSWTDERRAAMGENMRRIRSERKWPKK